MSDDLETVIAGIEYDRFHDAPPNAVHLTQNEWDRTLLCSPPAEKKETNDGRLSLALTTARFVFGVSDPATGS